MTKITVDLPPAPEGYEYTGEYRNALSGEPFLGHSGAIRHTGKTAYAYLILRKVQWRAREGEPYFFFSLSSGRRCLVSEALETSFGLDDIQHASGNYFKTREEAEEKAKAVYQLLIK